MAAPYIQAAKTSPIVHQPSSFERRPSSASAAANNKRSAVDSLEARQPKLVRRLSS
jgi:hypothetical protein